MAAGRLQDAAKGLVVAAGRFHAERPLLPSAAAGTVALTYRQAELRCHLGRQPGSAADQSVQDWTRRRKVKRENYREGRVKPPRHGGGTGLRL